MTIGNILVFIGAVVVFPAGVVLAEVQLRQNPAFKSMIDSARSSFNELVNWLTNQNSMTMLTEISKYFAVASVIILVFLVAAQKMNSSVPSMLPIVFIFVTSCTGALGWFLLLRNAWPIVLAAIAIMTILPILYGDHNSFLEYQVSDLCRKLENLPFNCLPLLKIPTVLQLSAIVFIAFGGTIVFATALSFALVVLIVIVISTVLKFASYLEKNYTESAFDGLAGIMAIVGGLLLVLGAFMNL